jgi:hypothetical protein
MGAIKKSIKDLVRKNLGFEIVNVTKRKTYNQDALITAHNHDFVDDPDFIKAYKRGIKAWDLDPQMPWRTHVALWAASHGKLLEGDFVECGVYRGFLSSAVMQFLDWNKLDRQFYLFDTFRGLDEKLVSDSERKKGRMEMSKQNYSECYDKVKANFAEFKNVHLVRGSIPDTLKDVKISKVAYLSIDMNCVAPEIAAANFFWDRMVSGAIAVLDDYAFAGFEDQKNAFDQFAIEKGIRILSMPTGQGVYIKP